MSKARSDGISVLGKISKENIALPTSNDFLRAELKAPMRQSLVIDSGSTTPPRADTEITEPTIKKKKRPRKRKPKKKAETATGHEEDAQQEVVGEFHGEKTPETAQVVHNRREDEALEGKIQQTTSVKPQTGTGDPGLGGVQQNSRGQAQEIQEEPLQDDGHGDTKEPNDGKVNGGVDTQYSTPNMEESKTTQGPPRCDKCTAYKRRVKTARSSYSKLFRSIEMTKEDFAAILTVPWESDGKPVEEDDCTLEGRPAGYGGCEYHRGSAKSKEKLLKLVREYIECLKLGLPFPIPENFDLSALKAEKPEEDRAKLNYDELDVQELAPENVESEKAEEYRADASHEEFDTQELVPENVGSEKAEEDSADLNYDGLDIQELTPENMESEKAEEDRADASHEELDTQELAPENTEPENINEYIEEVYYEESNPQVMVSEWMEPEGGGIIEEEALISPEEVEVVELDVSQSDEKNYINTLGEQPQKSSPSAPVSKPHTKPTYVDAETMTSSPLPETVGRDLIDQQEDARENSMNNAPGPNIAVSEGLVSTLNALVEGPEDEASNHNRNTTQEPLLQEGFLSTPASSSFSEPSHLGIAELIDPKPAAYFSLQSSSETPALKIVRPYLNAAKKNVSQVPSPPKKPKSRLDHVARSPPPFSPAHLVHDKLLDWYVHASTQSKVAGFVVGGAAVGAAVHSIFPAYSWVLANIVPAAQAARANIISPALGLLNANALAPAYAWATANIR